MSILYSCICPFGLENQENLFIHFLSLFYHVSKFGGLQSNCLLSKFNIYVSRKFESVINCPLWNSHNSSRLSWISGVPKGLRASSVLFLLDLYRVCCNKSLELSDNVFRVGFSSRLKHKSSRLFLS